MHDLPAGATLNKLRLRGAPLDAVRARLALERALQQVDWQPPALPAEAILFVRQLGVPATSAGPRWPQRVEQALRAQLDHARRPWLQADSAQASAVLFSDESELLACLVLDWLDGHLERHWWWRSVLGAHAPGPWLNQRLLARGERLLPVARRLLVGNGVAAGSPGSGLAADVLQRWFSRLSAAEAVRAIAAVELAHALPLPLPLPVPLQASERARLRRAARAGERSTQVALQPTAPGANELGIQRLRAVVPELRDTPLRGPQRHLLALVLSLLRAPSQTRTPALASALSALAQTDFDITATATRRRARGVAGPVHAHAERDGVRTSADDNAAPSGLRSEHRAPRPSEPPASASLRRAALHAAPRFTTQPHDEHCCEPTHAVTAAVTPAVTAAVTPATTPAHRVPRGARASERPQAAVLATPITGVQTDFGGVFYLLNAALASGLYADFTAPLTPGLALSPWNWLAWVGRAWFGRAFKRDPLWRLLADLAGRPVWQHPAHGFRPPPGWTPPADWQALCATAPGLQRAVRTLQYGSRRPRCWLRALLAALQARLALALGMEDACGSEDAFGVEEACGVDGARSVPRLLCCHAATLQVDDAAVRVCLVLNDLPLAIRIAGLDRDTGWIPAAGRSLSFEFR